MTIGERIKAAREQAGITQVELGEKIGVSGVAIMRYEKNARQPRLEQLQAIATALGVSVGHLLGQESERVIIPGRLKFVEVNDPESGFIRYNIEAADQEAFDYGLQILENAGISVQSHIPQALVLAAMDKLNYDGQQKVVERAEELTEIPRYRRQDGPVGVSPAPGDTDTPTAKTPTEEPPEGE